ncbi:ABC transporter permease subunit [Metabacillus iocasae]|uniref:ABC-2 type transport system permease protein n=1 Tax=Priestia iocasae TaxID=2291674 RepID=A0ABS2QWH6_9BACI|nr:ABC transporter permease subunit [Metabacillus iocasae]MBM7703814.1 ABC-2 type transport system permease protein [Metabacillus iocasae]
MSRSLFFTMLKVHGKSIASYTIGSTFYLLLIVMIYPSVSNVKGLNDIIAAMPENFLKAFGIEGGLSSLSDFLAGEYYGLLLLVILSIYCMTTATGSLAKLVDNGSMAYLLATPNSRVKISFTQAVLGIVGLFIIIGVTTLAGILGGEYLIETSDFDKMAFIQMNVAAFFLFFVISSYSFFFSALMNDEKKALSLPAALTIVFYACDLIGKMSEKFEWMRSLSLFSLFNPIEIGRGNEDIFMFCILFGLIGIAIYTLSILIFSKRDLPL